MMALFLSLLQDGEFWKAAWSVGELEEQKLESKAWVLSDITCNHKVNSVYEYRITFLRISLVGWDHKINSTTWWRMIHMFECNKFFGADESAGWTSEW